MFTNRQESCLSPFDPVWLVRRPLTQWTTSLEPISVEGACGFSHSGPAALKVTSLRTLQPGIHTVGGSTGVQPSIKTFKYLHGFSSGHWILPREPFTTWGLDPLRNPEEPTVQLCSSFTSLSCQPLGLSGEFPSRHKLIYGPTPSKWPSGGSQVKTGICVSLWVPDHDG